MNIRTLVISTVLLFLFFTGILIRLSYYQRQFAGFVPYSAESASHYYYAKRIQSGLPVPRIDKSIQYPEGLQVFKKTSIFMEYITAWLYNHFFSKITRFDFHFFTRFTMPFFYLFSLFAVFISGFCMTRSMTAALAASALFVFSRGSIERSSGFEYLSENFSLPFIFFHFSLSALGFQKKEKQNIFFLLSGMALSIALCSWKIAQFYLMVFSVFLLVLFLFSSETQTIQKCALFTSVFCILSGFVTPYLQEGKFLMSTPCLLLFFISLASSGGARFTRPSARLFLFVVFAAVTAAAYLFLLPLSFRTSMYSHVYGMIIYKLKFFLQKPLDASLLPPDVRAFWVPPFLSPPLREMLNAFPLVLPLSLGGCVYVLSRHRNKKTPVEIFFLVFFTFFFFMFYILFSRMRAFLAFFSCLTSVVLLYRASEGKKRFFAVLCMILLATETYHSLSMNTSLFTRALFGLHGRIPAQKISLYYENTLLDAVLKTTQTQDVILARWALSPMIHAYANRRVVLHAFFESPDIREKTQTFNKGLFSPEEEFYKQCKAWRATVLILAKNMVEENTVSERYMAGAKTLKPSMAVVKLLNEKNVRSKYFQLLYENGMFRMFRVL